MVELIRRVIPADICGGNVNRLRRMDAMTHILYEVAGTSGAFASSAAITRFGNNYSFMLSPIFFAIAGVIWFFIVPTRKILYQLLKARVQRRITLSNSVMVLSCLESLSGSAERSSLGVVNLLGCSHVTLSLCEYHHL
jgi:hypothetical protein